VTTLITTTVVVLAMLCMLCMLTSLVSSVVILVTLLHPTTLTWTMGRQGHTSTPPSRAPAPTPGQIDKGETGGLGAAELRAPGKAVK